MESEVLSSLLGVVITPTPSKYSSFSTSLAQKTLLNLFENGRCSILFITLERTF
jgi:hypothetical protein